MRAFGRGTTIDGRYRLLSPIGRGGMATVWCARDEVLDRLVAVKMMTGAIGDDHLFRDHLRKEARAAARLAHPHVTSVHDYGAEPVPYIVMELLDGEPLADRLESGPAVARGGRGRRAGGGRARRRAPPERRAPRRQRPQRRPHRRRREGRRLRDLHGRARSGGNVRRDGRGYTPLPRARGRPRRFRDTGQRRVRVGRSAARDAASGRGSRGDRGPLPAVPRRAPGRPAGERRGRGIPAGAGGRRARAGSCGIPDRRGSPPRVDADGHDTLACPAICVHSWRKRARRTPARAGGGGFRGPCDARRYPRRRERVADLSTGTSAAAGRPTQQPTTTDPATPPRSATEVVARQQDDGAGDSNGEAPNQLTPGLDLFNAGPAPVELSRVTIRYWFTKDEGPGEFATWCDYAAIGCENVRLRVVRLGPPREGADHVLEVTFAPAAGRLDPEEATGEIQNRFNKTDWSAYDQSDDYSYAAATSYADAPNVTVYVDGRLSWGTEP